MKVEEREQYFKDEYEQAVKRKGELYAEYYVEGLRDMLQQRDKVEREIVLNTIAFMMENGMAKNMYLNPDEIAKRVLK